MWSSFLDTFWDSCSGKFPKIILSKPHCFPSSAHFKLCNILVAARYRPAPQPRQTCQLPSPCLGGVCLTIPLAHHWMATTLVQSCLTVITGVKPSISHGSICSCHFSSSGSCHELILVSSWWGWERWVCCPDVSLATSSSPSELDVQSVTEMGAPLQEPSTLRIKKLVLPQVIIREHSRVRRQGTGKC